MLTVNMYSVIFLLVAVALSSSTALEDECKKLGAPHFLKCCNYLPQQKDIHHFKPDNAKECMSKMKPPPNCDADICIAKKLAYAGSEDGKFDKKALEETINEQFEKSPEIAEAVVKNCINGDLSDFGPPDFCDLTKFRHCLHMHLALGCTEWDASDLNCIETKDLVERCKI